jgi:glycosyltransferase involved in cell wall biosynthesis
MRIEQLIAKDEQVNILYISCYPQNYFSEIISKLPQSTSQPAQKFNKLIVDGLKYNNVDVSVLITHDILNQNYSHSIQVDDGINYFFMPNVTDKRLQYICSKKNINKFLRAWFIENPNCTVILDFLKPYAFYVAKAAKGKKIVAIITDLPEHLLDKPNGLLQRAKYVVRTKRYQKIIEYATHFVFLTEQMNVRLNQRNKPYCIIEGLVDANMENIHNNCSKRLSKVICLYSGDLSAKYGLDLLVSAFINCQRDDWELHLYGNGDYVNEIKMQCEKYSSIKYFGIVQNEIVVHKQMEATVLINPRPTHKEFAKYSFPSKNMEYMASGRPVITTKLPGMPEEYKEYVYLIEDESISGIETVITEVMSKSPEKLTAFGERAKEFVLQNKNNHRQTAKIISLIDETRKE